MASTSGWVKSWPHSPPNCQAPTPMTETFSPVLPSCRYSTRSMRLAALGRDLPFEGGHEAALDVGRNGLRVHALIDLDRLAGRVGDDPAVRTFGDVCLELGADLGVERLFQVVAQFAKKVLTGKQRRRLPCA